MTDLFHQTLDGNLDRKYLRVCVELRPVMLSGQQRAQEEQRIRAAWKARRLQHRKAA